MYIGLYIQTHTHTHTEFTNWAYTEYVLLGSTHLTE